MKLVLFSTIAAAISLVAAIPLENASPVQQDASAAVPTGTTASSTSPSPISVTFSGILPSHSPTYLPSFPYNGHEKKSPTPTGALTYKPTFNVSSYPIPWDKPDLNNTEIQAAINSINWTYVPNIPPKNMTTDVTTYNSGADPDCWWTVSTCGEPKLTYLPKDVKYCPKVGDFGLVCC
jgi:hypothetical protein